MSTLVIVLTAAMMVPGNGPEMELGEIAEPQRLDLSGEWKATLYYKGDILFGKSCIGKIVPFGPAPAVEGLLVTYRRAKESGSFLWGSVPVDEGNGRFRIGSYLGIYRYEGKCLHLCFREAKNRRPTSFHANDDQVYLILHRVKPRK